MPSGGFCDFEPGSTPRLSFLGGCFAIKTGHLSKHLLLSGEDQSSTPSGFEPLCGVRGPESNALMWGRTVLMRSRARSQVVQQALNEIYGVIQRAGAKRRQDIHCLYTGPKNMCLERQIKECKSELCILFLKIITLSRTTCCRYKPFDPYPNFQAKPPNCYVIESDSVEMLEQSPNKGIWA